MNKYILIIMVAALFIQSCKDSDGDNGGNTVLPSLSVGDVVTFEGNEDNTIEVTVTLAGTNLSNVIVSYATIDGTAVGGSDFVSIPDGELIFGPSETQKTISVIIKGDDLNEGNESFEILLLNPSNATLSDERGTITLTNDDGGNNSIIPSGGTSSPLTYPGMTLVWADEFQSNTLDLSSWTHEIGNGEWGWGNNELQYYAEENTSIYGSEYLVIEARKNGNNYTSSRIITKDKREFQYGRVDIRAAVPKGQGIWPALWMLGVNIDQVSWPACGEIDIMEIVGHAPNRVHGTVHYGTSNAQHQSQGSSKYLSGADYSDEFHVYSLVWEENNIQVLVDDQVYFEVNSTQMLNGQPYPFNQDFFFIFNVAVGGEWPGDPDNTTVFPARMVVDYVRVFQ